MPTFKYKRDFNPTLKTIIKTFEYIVDNQPVSMDTIPLCRHAGYKWLWGMKDNDLVRIERSQNDGRVHLVWLSDQGRAVLIMLRKIKDADNIKCHKCDDPIIRFFRVSNEEWKNVTGDEHDQVICKTCFDRMKEESILCGGK